MKKVLLTCFVAMSIFAADAQSKKSTSEKKAKAEFAKKEKERQERFRLEREERLTMDSIRREEERLARDTFEMQRAEWMANRLREIDSTNQEKWKKQSTERELAYQSDRTQKTIAKNAKLNSYQGRQIQIINQTYSDKAAMIRQDTLIAESDKRQQLASLNAERKAKIKTVIGNSRAKRLEKEQAKYYKQYGMDPQLAWIDEAEGMVKN